MEQHARKQQKQLPPTFLPPAITDPHPSEISSNPTCNARLKRPLKNLGILWHQTSPLVKCSGQIHVIQHSECCLSRPQPWQAEKHCLLLHTPNRLFTAHHGITIVLFGWVLTVIISASTNNTVCV